MEFKNSNIPYEREKLLPIYYKGKRLNKDYYADFICFDENNERIYKGEGTIQFIAYSPYAKSVHKFLNEFDDSFYTNKTS